jgi:hypothetical protein
VQISRNSKGKGKITLHFADADEFDRLYAMLKASVAAAA